MATLVGTESVDFLVAAWNGEDDFDQVGSRNGLKGCLGCQGVHFPRGEVDEEDDEGLNHKSPRGFGVDEDEEGDGDCKGQVDQKEQTVREFADRTKGSGDHKVKEDEGEHACEDHGYNEAVQAVDLDEEVEVEGCVEVEEGGGDAGQDAVPSVDALMGGFEKVAQGVEGLERQEVLERILGDSNQAESFGEMKIVYVRD